MEEKDKRRKSFSKILEETRDCYPKRRHLIKALQERDEFKGKKVITFFTSFQHPVNIVDNDAIMLEEVLQNTNLTGKGLLLVLNSPGGDALAAERIINVCRKYSNNNFDVLVPNKAKSAATIISFGSNKIWMSATSELGPIDPQTFIKSGGDWTRVGMAFVIKNYDDLFKKAVKCKERIEPFLQQLERLDSRVIEEYRSILSLSPDIAVKSLKTGMMSKLNQAQIKKNIMPFLLPQETKVHGRPIFIKQAKECKLKIGELDLRSEIWDDIWDLYLRTDYVVNHQYAKIVESDEDEYFVFPPKYKGD